MDVTGDVLRMASISKQPMLPRVPAKRVTDLSANDRIDSQLLILPRREERNESGKNLSESSCQRFQFPGLKSYTENHGFNTPSMRPWDLLQFATNLKISLNKRTR
jgi:hypothetical protein